jgi:hypothetical protein
MDHQIVARPGFYGDGRSCKNAAPMEWTQTRAARSHAPHRITDVRDREGAILLDDVARHCTLSRRDPIASSHGTPLQIIALPATPLHQKGVLKS